MWFFHAPGSGLFLNVSGRPVTHEIYHWENYAAVKRAVSDGTVMIRYAAWYGATEVILHTDDAVTPTHPVACPNVPFTCTCTAPHKFAMCNTSAHQPANVVRDFVPSPWGSCHPKKHWDKCTLIAALGLALAAAIIAVAVGAHRRNRVPTAYTLVSAADNNNVQY